MKSRRGQLHQSKQMLSESTCWHTDTKIMSCNRIILTIARVKYAA